MIDVNDVTVPSNISADDIERIIPKLKKENGLSGLGEAFIQTEEEYNINAIFLLSIACLESSYGLSELAEEKNNLFGIDARDSLKGTDAYGRAFSSKAECIDYAGNRMRNQYIEYDSKASWRYCKGKKDIASIGRIWCSRKDWSTKVKNLCERIEDLINTISDSNDIEIEDGVNYKELYLDLKAKVDNFIINLQEGDEY